MARGPFAGGSPVQIGRFTVLRTIGQGGMGVVYACYDERLDRKIAVKVLLVEATRDTATARARLLREAQTLARLSHPNVVAVYEVGQDHGVVYVAMEFVRGVGLDVWTAQPRPWQEVLAAYLQAGRGLKAAHQAGIIHRDFKPQNVLVDDTGLVKVLDFGLARAVDDAPPEEGLASRDDALEASDSALLRPLTRTGARLGTPAFMSPEQHRGEVATAASDQFSFCVSLYQSLYGALPFATTSLEALREDVLRGRVAPAPLRSAVPTRVFKALRTGMSVEPSARFASMADLLAELARDPAARYRRLAAFAATAVVAGVASFAAADAIEPGLERCPDASAELAGVWDDERAAVVRAAVQAAHGPRADERLARLEPLLAGYSQGWVQRRNEACRAHGEGRLSARLFDLQTSCLDQRRAGLDALVEALVRRDGGGLDALVQAAVKLPALDGCTDTQALLAALPPPDDATTRARVQERRETLARAQIAENAAQYASGGRLVEAVLASAEAQVYEPLLAEALLRQGSLQMESGAHAAAETSLERATVTALGIGHAPVAAQASAKLAFLRAVFLGRAAQARADLALVAAFNRRVQPDVELYAEYLNNVGAVHAAAGDFPAARVRWTEALALRAEHGRAETPGALVTQANLGWLAQHENRFTDMAEIYRAATALSERLLGPEHATHMRYERLLADSLHRLGRPREALARLRALERRAGQIESDLERGKLLFALGSIELDEEEDGPAKDHLDRALAAVGDVPADRDLALLALMRLAARQGDAAAVQAWHDRVSARLALPRDPDDPAYQALLYAYGQALELLGRPRDAVAPLETLREILVREATSEHALQGAEVALALGRLRLRLGEHELAEQELERALAVLQRTLPERSISIADVDLALGQLALERRRFADAARFLGAAESIYAGTAEADHLPLARARLAYAHALTGAAGTAPAQARTYAKQAIDALRARGRDAEVRAAETWRAEHG